MSEMKEQKKERDVQTWGQSMCWALPLNSHIPPPLHGNSNAPEKSKVKPVSRADVQHRPTDQNVCVNLHAVLDMSICGYQWRHVNTEQSLGVKSPWQKENKKYTE